jgi:ActR/RegA family two-component response regulator
MPFSGTNLSFCFGDLNIHSESDGYEVVRAMRQRNREAVVIILTGYPAMQSAIGYSIESE